MKVITRILKALRTYGVDVLLLGFLEKLLDKLIQKLIALQTAAREKKLRIEEARKQPTV